MKGLKIIPLFLLLMGLSYTGVLFVQANSEMVNVELLGHTFPSTSVGLIILSSVFLGMVCCGLLCSIEILALYVQNRKLRKKIQAYSTELKNVSQRLSGNSQPNSPGVTAQDRVIPKATGRFT